MLTFVMVATETTWISFFVKSDFILTRVKCASAGSELFTKISGNFKRNFPPYFRILATTNNDQGIIQDKKIVLYLNLLLNNVRMDL